MKTKRSVSVITICLLGLLFGLTIKSMGTPDEDCHGKDGNTYYYCDSGVERICMEISMNGETHTCKGKKYAVPDPAQPE